MIDVAPFFFLQNPPSAPLIPSDISSPGRSLDFSYLVIDISLMYLTFCRVPEVPGDDAFLSRSQKIITSTDGTRYHLISCEHKTMILGKQDVR